MPTYEFRCPNGHVFDRRFSKISDAPSDVACPDCGQLAHRQISGGAGLVFKGSGFYLTDYGKNAHRGNAPKSGDKGGDAKGGEPKPGGSDAKPAGDSASKPSDAGAAGASSSKSESKAEKPSGTKPDSGGSKKSSGGSNT
jgi:putative FmdB family regulatory protein